MATNIKELQELGLLKNSGFTAEQIVDLFQFRNTQASRLIAETQQNNVNVENTRRLEFIRWLVKTGKLNEGF